MVFKKMLSKLGVGGPAVETIVHTPRVQPGGTVRGEVQLVGGEADAAIEYLTLALVTRVEHEGGGHEFGAKEEFLRVPVAADFHLLAKQERVLPFEFVIPWETPVTEVYGQRLRGMTLGIRTELAIAKAVDKSDLDVLEVTPLPAQLQILDAVEDLGFRFKSADLEAGRLAGVRRQELPFFQEIEFYSPGGYGVTEVEVTFVAGPAAMDVIFEADRRGGLFTSGGDSYLRLQVEYASAATTDWAAQIEAWLRQLSQFAGHRHSSHHSHGRRHGHGGHYGRDVGMGAVAGGFLGGMLAGEVLDDMFDGDD